MLVLTRSNEQRSIIVKHQGEALELVVWIEGGKVRCGFEAPESFEVLRKEVAEREAA